MGRNPTLADIAARTGYGTNTVSLALRGSTRISEKARNSVQAAAMALDYVPNNHAKSLVLNKSQTVGMILQDITNPLMNSVGKALQLELARRGYAVLFATNETTANEDRAIEMFRARMVDGLLIYPLDHKRLDHLRRLRSHNFPVVLLIGSDNVHLDAVGIDEFRGAYDATTHLIALGHRHIGAIVRTDSNTEKLEGFRHAHKVHGIPLGDTQVVAIAQNSVAFGIEAMDVLTAREPRITAVFAATDVLALGVLRWAHLNNIHVPRDLSVVGFDNIEAAEYAVTSLTTVTNDITQAARSAVDRLLVLIEAEGTLPPPASKLLRGDLVIRESSARRKDD